MLHLYKQINTKPIGRVGHCDTWYVWLIIGLQLREKRLIVSETNYFREVPEREDEDEIHNSNIRKSYLLFKAYYNLFYFVFSCVNTNLFKKQYRIFG